MNKDQITIYMNSESGQDRSGYNGFKIIEVNVSSSSDTLYAVCTPVKMKQQSNKEG